MTMVWTSISLKWCKYIFPSVKPLPTCPAPPSGVLGTHCHHSLNITLSVKLSKFVWVCLLSSNSVEFIHEVRHVIDVVVRDYKRYKQILGVHNDKVPCFQKDRNLYKSKPSGNESTLLMLEKLKSIKKITDNVVNSDHYMQLYHINAVLRKAHRHVQMHKNQNLRYSTIARVQYTSL